MKKQKLDATFSVTMTKDQHLQLMQHCNTVGLSRSHVVRIALDIYFSDIDRVTNKKKGKK